MHITRRIKAAVAAVASTGLAISFFIASPAHAGSNGQTLRFCGVPTGIRSIVVNGYNQNNQYISREWYIVPSSSQCYDADYRYWWKGTVSLEWRDGRQPVKITSCWVPERQSGSNITTCTY